VTEQRAGHEDRKFHAKVITQGYMSGYLDDLELQDRLDKASTARRMTDLRALVSDIPPVPVKVKSHVRLNPRRFWNTLGYDIRGRVGIGIIGFGLLTAVLPDVYIGESHPVLGAVWPVVMIAFIVVGVLTAILGCATAGTNFDKETVEFRDWRLKNKGYSNYR
jgi:hypothetical protein